MATQMRDYILGVASEMFATRGINATSVDTIVAEAGIAKVTLYKYFKSKEQLILEYLRQYDAQLWNRLTERIAARGSTPVERLRALVGGIMEWIADPEFKGFAFVNASVEFPQSGNPVHQTSLEFVQTLRNSLAAMARDAGMKNPDTLALQLALVIEGAAITEQLQRGEGAVEHARQMADILIDAAR